MRRHRYIHAAVGLCALLLALGLYGLPHAAQAQNPGGFAFSGEADPAYRAGAVFASGLDGPFGMAFDAAGNLYVANETGSGTYSHTIVQITPAGVISTFATGFAGPSGVAFDSSGLLHISDDTHRVFRVSGGGVVTEFIPFSAGLNNPNVIAFDSADNIYIGNAGASQFLSKFDSSGAPVNLTFVPDLYLPQGIVVDNTAGVLYLSEGDGTISLVNLTTGAVSPYANMGAFGGTQGGLVRDSAGNLYYSDYFNNRVLRIDASNRVASICQTGISLARGLAFDASGNLYVTSYDTGAIWKFTGCEAPGTGAAYGYVTESAAPNDPIEDAQVCADYDDNGQHIGCDCTTADGRYTIYNVDFNRPFSLKSGGHFGVCDPGLSYEKTTINGLTTSSGTPVIQQDIALNPGGAVSGTITDSVTTTGIENMQVCANYESGEHIQCLCTEPGGTYEIHGIGYDRPFTLGTGGDTGMCDMSLRYVGQNVQNLTVTDGTPQIPQNFALDPGGEVNGTVTEDQAPYDPIENITVCANYDDNRHIHCVCTETGGVYSIRGIEFDEPFNVAAGGGSSMCDTSLNYGQVRYD
ncbi:MAG: NHL repeat-containing protein, partial [Anaerolineae bacterium]|nr:NHL repeat-containing protein [Anaerolineae bacterium]